MNVRYRVDLNQEERDQLGAMLSGGKHAARRLKRAQILLAADAREPDVAIAANVCVGLSTHCPGALYEAFPAPEAHRILQNLEFHYTPKHASWLNMVEIEIGVLRGQCLNRRIGERKKLVSEIDAWQKQRNAAKARIKWMFTTDKARDKLGRAYPNPAKES